MSTTNTGLNQPLYNSTGWDTPLNNNMEIVNGYLTITVTVSYSSPSTVTNINLTGPVSNPLLSSLGQVQSQVVRCTGTLTADSTLTFPAGISGGWIIRNSTSGSYKLTVKTAAVGGATVDIQQGYSSAIYSDGTDILFADSGILAATLPGKFGALTATSIANSGNETIAGTLDVDGALTAGSIINEGNQTIAGTLSVTKKVTAQGDTSTLGVLVNNISETATVSGSSATGTINFDLTTQSVLYYTANASANFTLNVRGNGTTTLNSILSNGQAVTLVFMNTNGTTAYYANVFQIDGATQTVKWVGGSAPGAGNASSIDVYSYTIIKTSSGTYTVLGSLTKFA